MISMTKSSVKAPTGRNPITLGIALGFVTKIINMKKKLPLILIIYLSTNLLVTAQKKPIDTLYWYKLDIAIVLDSMDFKPLYKILKVYPDVISGTERDYLKFQKENMQYGTLAIGPFKEKESATFSSHFYANWNIDSINQEYYGAELYFYIGDVRQIKKNNGLEFNHVARLQSLETPNEFKEMLFEGLSLMFFSIGPFPNQSSAEYSYNTNKILEPKRHNEYRYIDYYTYYWFQLKVDNQIDSIENKHVYKISETPGKVIWGTSKAFVDNYLDNLKKKLTTIGPFEYLKDAELSRETYMIAKKTSNFDSACNAIALKYSINPEDQYYSYFGRFEQNKSKKKIYYKTSPARISEDTYQSFTEMMMEGLMTDNLLLGPFSTLEVAEVAKAMQRFLGSKKTKLFLPKPRYDLYNAIQWPNHEQPKHSFNSKAKLKRMSKDFKSTLSNCSAKIDSISKQVSLDINFKFPSKYFDKYSIMVLTVGVVYNDSTIFYTRTQTLQGQRVEDNCIVVSWDKGYQLHYDPSWQIPNDKDKKIEKLLIENTYSDSKNKIKGKNIEIKWPDVQKN